MVDRDGVLRTSDEFSCERPDRGSALCEARAPAHADARFPVTFRSEHVLMSKEMFDRAGVPISGCGVCLPLLIFLGGGLSDKPYLRTVFLRMPSARAIALMESTLSLGSVDIRTKYPLPNLLDR